MVRTITQARTSTYMLGELVTARRSRGVVLGTAGRSKSGVLVETGADDDAEFYVGEGAWAVVPMPHQGAPFVQTDEAFRAHYVALDHAPDMYVSRGAVVRGRVSGARMLLEDGSFRPLASFLEGASRLSAEGRVVCHANMPLQLQARLLLLAEDDVSDHFEALQARRDKVSFIFSPPEAQEDALLYDALMSGAQDDIDDDVALHYATSESGGLTVVTEGTGVEAFRPRDERMLDRLCVATGLPAHAFDELRHVPYYMIEQFRALAREALGPYLSFYPMEEVLHFCAPDMSPLERGMAWARKGRLVDHTDGIEVPAVPGYVTTDVFVHSRDGICIMTFADMFGFHMLAWPSP